MPSVVNTAFGAVKIKSLTPIQSNTYQAIFHFVSLRAKKRQLCLSAQQPDFRVFINLLPNSSHRGKSGAL